MTVNNHVWFGYDCVLRVPLYYGDRWAPLAPVLWPYGRGARSWALLCCPDPTVGSMHARGPSVLTHCGKDQCAADPGGKDLCAAKAVVACMFSQRFLSAERNLFVLRSKVYRQSIHGSISCTHQLLYWRSWKFKELHQSGGWGLKILTVGHCFSVFSRIQWKTLAKPFEVCQRPCQIS